MVCAMASGSRTTTPAKNHCLKNITSPVSKTAIWKTWYPSGQQKQQASFKNGKRNGTSIEFDDKGQKVLELEYSDDKLNGTATRWFPDGRKIVQTYEAGKLKSESKQ